MVNLNKLTVGDEEAVPMWTVLVYDSLGQDIISPLLRVAELRENGVTLHLYVQSV